MSLANDQAITTPANNETKKTKRGKPRRGSSPVSVILLKPPNCPSSLFRSIWSSSGPGRLSVLVGASTVSPTIPRFVTLVLGDAPLNVCSSPMFERVEGTGASGSRDEWASLTGKRQHYGYLHPRSLRLSEPSHHLQTSKHTIMEHRDLSLAHRCDGENWLPIPFLVGR